jgi:hypothetical protein
MPLHESHDNSSSAPAVALPQIADCGASGEAPMVSPFTVIDLGYGNVKIGDSIHNGELPALWFGKDGQGMGVEEVLNRPAYDGETLAVVTFANVEGLDVLIEVVQRIRRESFPNAMAPQSVPEGYALVPITPTPAMIEKGEYVNSEWLNDNAPIGQRRYRDPAIAVYKAMLLAASEAQS